MPSLVPRVGAAGSAAARREIVVLLAGGLGNQLFQYAMGRRVALRTGATLVLDPVSGFARDPYRRTFALDHFNVAATLLPANQATVTFAARARRALFRASQRWLPVNERRYLQEVGTAYDPAFEAFHPLGRRACLQGYWQHHQYFAGIRELLLADLTLRRPLDAANAAVAGRIAEVRGIAVHVRHLHGEPARPLPPNSPLYLDAAYYERAMERLAARVPHPHFFVFSDDPDWARAHVRTPHPIEFVTHNGPEAAHLDLRLMSGCRHFVIANSTFSWWAAWLCTDPDKTVVAPRDGLGAGLISTPPEWTLY